ncbi:MAG TPA: metal-dependent hydrolase [Parasegetibacter sp.]|jgi:inner membrane protein
MDSLTHIVVGACLGEVILGRQMGRKGMMLGAIAQNFPDIDAIAGFWMSGGAELLAHRGLTHSFFFVLVISPLLSWLCLKWQLKAGVLYYRWIIFWMVQLLVHIFLDTCNSYGTGLLEPFSDQRFQLDLLFVADPFFTIWPLLFSMMLMFKRIPHPIRFRMGWIGVLIPLVYVICATRFKVLVTENAERSAMAKNIRYDKIFTTPTPLNSLLWWVVIPQDSGYYVGYRSVLDKFPHTELEFIPRNDTLAVQSTNQVEYQLLKKFSAGYYTLEQWSDTLVFNDLRFGRMKGWEEKNARFAFHYFLNLPDANGLVIQRGRFTGWNSESYKRFFDRILGR